MVLPDWSTLTIRSAVPADRPALARLAALDSKAAPAGPMLLGEVGGEPWAAVSLDGTTTIADPFRPSARLVLLLQARARQVRGGRRRIEIRRVRLSQDVVGRVVYGRRDRVRAPA